MCHMTFLLPVPLPLLSSNSLSTFQTQQTNSTLFNFSSNHSSPNSHQMNLQQKTTIITHMSNPITVCLLFALLLGTTFYTFLAYYIGNLRGSSAAFYLLAAVVVVLAAVVIARTVIVACITVLVLQTFVGNRRRVLVREGKKITAEIGGYLIRVLISERKGAFTFACAAVVSLLAMAGLVESVSLSQRW